MNSELLIETVQAYPELYDMTHPKYMDFAHKDEIWKAIGNLLDLNAASCKVRWNNIRDQYRKCIKKRRVDENGRILGRCYKYEGMLEFLDLHLLQERGDHSGSRKCKTEKPETRLQPESNSEEDDNSNVNSVNNDNDNLILKPEDSFHGNLSRGYSMNQDICYPWMNYGMTPDPVDAFLSGIAYQLKTFPPVYLNMAKTEIFNVVQEIELNIIKESEKQNCTKD